VPLLWIVLFLSCSAALAAQDIDLDRIRAEEEFRWGVRAFHNGFFNEALVAFNKSLSYKPQDAAARIWLGRAFYQSGFNDACLAEWKAVIAAGKGTPLLENLTDILESRRGIGRELRARERWVVAGEITGSMGETILFRRPTVVRARRDGSFYLVGFISNEIGILDSNGLLRGSLRGGLQGFDHPFDILEAPDGSLYVSEFRGDRVAKCDGNGNKILTIGSKGRGEGELLGPQYIALDDSSNLYVSDWGNRRISKFDKDGKFLLSFGGRTAFYPGLAAPTGLVYLNGNLYVADKERKHLAVFDASGNYLTTLLEGRLSAPEGITVLADGTFLISDTQKLYFYNAEEEDLFLATDFGSLAKRVLLADLDANGNLLAPDFDQNKLLILSELSGMYTGLTVMVNRITAVEHPDVLVDVKVTNRFGDPVVGLDKMNFVVSEGRVSVQPLELPFSGQKSERFEVALVVERSLALRDRRNIVERAAREVIDKIGSAGGIRVISAGPQPSLVAAPGILPELMARAAGDRPESYSRNWAFDLGVRLGATELIGERNRKALIYISSGVLGDEAFRNYGLIETAQYMKNNGISFYPVILAASGGSAELDYLAGETGGKAYRYFDAAALSSLIKDLRNQKDGGYLLRYRSVNDTDFGRRFIPLEVEATLIRRSGRDETGYFGPLKF
jgi:DNA-binding beta-propeller fold protein YncE